MANHLRVMLDVAEMTHNEGMKLSTQDLDLDDIDDIQVALELWHRADRQAKAAKLVKDVCGTRLAELLGDGGAAACGDTIVRYKLGRKERCIDPTAFSMFVTNEITERRIKIEDVYTATNAKKSWMHDAVRETFFEWVEDEEPRLIEVPRTKAPKWLQGLEDGAVIIKEIDDE